MRHFTFIRDLLHRLRRDERGNIFVLFGASALPLLLIMGGAVDIARYERYKTDLANAVDAAALALARQGEDFTEAQAKTFVTNYVTSFPVGDDQFNVQTFNVTKQTNGYLVTADGSMKTMFLPLAKLVRLGSGINSIDVHVVSQVVQSTNRVELAFVFDNTGSMTDNAGSNACGTGNDKMAGLKCAAKTLVASLNTEMNSGTDKMLKMAVVPFEGAVNVGVDTSNPPAWIDWDPQIGKAKFDGVNFGKYNFSTSATCTTGTNCKNVSHRWLYNKLGISWAGCVEMRAEPYELTDTVPDPTNPDTLYVPMFWPDEPDTSNDYWNSYLTDGVTGTGDQRQTSLTKYNKSSPSSVSWLSGQKDTTYPYSSGPNYGCPRPIIPLTANATTINNGIDAMQAQAATGTFIPAGLIWGWNVLSSTEPFTEGVAPSDPNFDKTVKAIVMMSDGANSPTVYINNNHNQSTYSAFNYTTTPIPPATNKYRLQSSTLTTPPTNSQAVAILNSKTATLCSNVKAAGIRLYTITFGTLDSTATSLMTACASVDDEGSPLYFHAPDSATLDDIFHTIGDDLSEIHLSM